MRPRARISLLLALLTALAIAALAHEGHKPVPSKGAAVQDDVVTLTAEARRAIGLRTAEVEVRPIERVVRARVTARAPWDGEAFASSPVAGTIEEVLVRPGDPVEHGQILAVIESQEIARLVLEREQAIERLRVARAAHERAASLAGEGVTAAKARLDAEAEEAEARILLEDIEGRLALLGAWTGGAVADGDRASGGSRASVRAPMAGVIAHVNVVRGASIEPLTHLFEIVDRSRVWADAAVLETDAPLVRAGQPVRLRIAGVEAAGAVDWIAPALDAGAGTLQAIVAVDNREARLLPGVTGTGEIVVETEEEALVVPARAVVRAGLGHVAFVEEGPGTYKRTSVRLGRTLGSRVVVEDGLYPGDVVIADGAHAVAALFHSGLGDFTPEVRRAAAIDVAPVSVRPLDETVRLPARLALDPDRSAFVSSRIDAILESVHVKPGDRVEREQIIATVSSPQVRLAVSECRVAAQRAALRRATLERVRALAAGGIGARKDLVEAESAARAASAALASARLRLGLLGMTEEEIGRVLAGEATPSAISLRSAIAGEVLHMDVTLGRFVRPDDHLVEIADASRVVVEMHAPEQIASRLGPGTPLRVELPAFPGERFETAVRAAIPRVDGASRTVRLLADLPNPDRRLRPGAAATAIAVIGRTPETIVVPRSSILTEGLRRFVLLVENAEVSRAEVELGRADDRFVEVVRGAYPGEHVVTAGAERVRSALAAGR